MYPYFKSSDRIPTMLQKNRRAFRSVEATFVAIAAMSITVVAVPNILNAMLTPHPPAPITVDDNINNIGSSPSGTDYILAEIQARTWHRNRVNRPYNFALLP